MLMDQCDEQIVGSVQKIITWAGKTVKGWVRVSFPLFLLIFFCHSIWICTTLHYLNTWNRWLSEQILQFPSKINIPNASRNGEPVCKSTTWKSLYIYLFISIPHLWYLSSHGTTDMMFCLVLLFLTCYIKIYCMIFSIIISLLLFRWWWPKTHSPWRCLWAM